MKAKTALFNLFRALKACIEMGLSYRSIFHTVSKKKKKKKQCFAICVQLKAHSKAVLSAALLASQTAVAVPIINIIEGWLEG